MRKKLRKKLRKKHRPAVTSGRPTLKGSDNQRLPFSTALKNLQSKFFGQSDLGRRA
jgi:hypothetical protein